MSDFLGRGIKFPYQINALGGTGTSAALEHINESIRQILGTNPGERIMLPDFGSRLNELIFEPNDDIFKSLIKTYVTDAIAVWEKRVKLTSIEILDQPDQHLVNIQIAYILISNQVEGNLVYPFYKA